MAGEVLWVLFTIIPYHTYFALMYNLGGGVVVS